MRIALILGCLALAGCQTVREPAVRVETVEVPTPVPCVDREDIPAEPPMVGDELTGNAVADLGVVAANAIELRIWGRTLLALIEPACVRV